MVEAMACGLPVVISDRVNIWREVKEARAAIVTQPDTGELAQALARVLDHPEVRRRMGAAGRILVRERLTWPTVADQMISGYGRVVGERLRPLPQPAWGTPAP